MKKDELAEDEDDFASKEHTILVELLIAFWYAVLSHTDFICYFFVFLNQVVPTPSLKPLFWIN